MASAAHPIGTQLRDWRQRRRISQMDLALDAGISTRHLSFVETGRSRPSRDVVLRLADRLDVPLRQQNTLLLAAGFAPAFGERALDDPGMMAVLSTVRMLLTAHEPNPAMLVDRHWNLVDANQMVLPLLTEVDAALLAPPVNVLRLTLAPGGLASRILNLSEWRAHVLHRLRRQLQATADMTLAELERELIAYGEDSPARETTAATSSDNLVVPLLLATPTGVLSLISTTTIFGTPRDVLLSEVAVEVFLPADDATAATLRSIQEAQC